MKAEATTAIHVVAASGRSAFAIWSDLVKARLTFLVLLTTLAGFYLGVAGATDWFLLFNTLLGTALVAAFLAFLGAGFDSVFRKSHASRPEMLSIDRPPTAGFAL